jgi:hypothetical protein
MSSGNWIVNQKIDKEVTLIWGSATMFTQAKEQARLR